MKITPEKVKLFTTELSRESSSLIEQFKNTNSAEQFIGHLERFTEWNSMLGKTEMGRWKDVLNECDNILDLALSTDAFGVLNVDRDEKFESYVIIILRFTSLLFENTFSRSIYSSMDRLLKLLESKNARSIVHTLRLLLIISKTSRYIAQHISREQREELTLKLTAIIESWTGKCKTVEMREFCCEDFVLPQAFFSIAVSDEKHFVVDKIRPYEELVSELQQLFDDTKPQSTRILLLFKLRFVYHSSNISDRFYLVMARLISTSILFYSRCLLVDEWRINCLSTDATIEQICSLLHLDIPKYSYHVDSIKTETLKTLASIVFLEKPRKIQVIVNALDLGTYHGFTPSLVRKCVERLRTGNIENCTESVNFVTALFSFIYHIAGLECGGDALISSSIISSLLEIVKFKNLPESYISFVTRSVRIIDILTGIDVTEFNNNDGMKCVVERFINEVNQCRVEIESTSTNMFCHQQRSALMKSILNFLKRAIVDANYAIHIRRIMESELPESITHIVQNFQYYGSSLLHCAINLTASFIYQEPAQLNFLQDKGLTDSLLDALFNDKFPITRDIITALPNLCSALCLNERGLRTFGERNPFERIFHMIFSTKFLLSMRKRKNEILDAASVLGIAFDELVRHHPTIRKDLLGSFSKILEEILLYETSCKDKDFVISWTVGKSGSTEGLTSEAQFPANQPRLEHNAPTLHPSSSSDILDVMEVQDDDILSGAEDKNQASTPLSPMPFHFCYTKANGKLVLPLGDYLGITGGILEAMLSNRGATENCNVMLETGILQLLIKLFEFLHTSKQLNSTVHQSSFLLHLAGIIRYTAGCSNKVDESFTLLVQKFGALSEFGPTADITKLYTDQKLSDIIQMGSLLTVFLAFFKGTMNTPQDTRPILLNFFVTKTGQTFFTSLFKSYQFFIFNNILLNAKKQPLEADSKKHLSQEEHSLSSETELNKQGFEAMEVDPIPSTSKSDQNESLEKTIQTLVPKCSKQITELIHSVAKALCVTSQNRPRNRAGLDALLKNSSLVTEFLFAGIADQIKNISEEPYDRIRVDYANSVFSLLKKLFEEQPTQNHLFLVSLFYNSKCHDSFFDFGSKFISPNLFKEEVVPCITSWLGIIQRLSGLSALVVGAKKPDAQTQVLDVDVKSYLSLCYRNAIKVLGSLLRLMIELRNHKWRPENSHSIIEKTLNCLQTLLRGVFDLHDAEQKIKQTPDMEVLLNELDPIKIQRLVEMGFAESESVDALIQHSSVTEAAEYLIAQMDQERRKQQSSQAVSVTQSPKDKEQSTSGELKPVSLEQFRETIDFICNSVLDQCISFVEWDKKFVFNFSEILSIFNLDPVATSWVEDVFLLKITIELKDLMKQFYASLTDGCVESNESLDKFSTFLHLFSSIWQHFPSIKICTSLEKDFCDSLLLLFSNFSIKKLPRRCISPILCFIDLMEKEKRMEHRQSLFKNNIENIKWFYWANDDRYGTTGDWKQFPIVCSSSLNRALNEKKPIAKVTLGEKNYNVDLVEMNYRLFTEHPTVHHQPSYPIFARASLKTNFDVDDLFRMEDQLSIGTEFHKKIVINLLNLINCDADEQPLDLELSYSTLFLLLHLTSFHSMAKVFVENDGITILLRLRSNEVQMTNVLNNVVALIIRNCLDDNETILEGAYTRIIHSAIEGQQISALDANKRFIMRSIRNRKDWRNLLRMFVPLATKNPRTYAKVMEQNVAIKNNEISLIQRQLAVDDSLTTQSLSPTLKAVIQSVVNELLDGNFDSDSTIRGNRVLKRVNLLKLLAELIKSYPNAANCLLDIKHNENSIIFCLISRYLVENTYNELSLASASNAVLTNLILASSKIQKVNDVIIDEIKGLLYSLQLQYSNDSSSSSKLSEGISILAKLIIHLRETAQNHETTVIDGSRQNYSFVRTIHKRNLMIDFARSIWNLPLDEKYACETVNTILKMFEGVLRDLILAHARLSHPSTTSDSSGSQHQTTPTTSESTHQANSDHLHHNISSIDDIHENLNQQVREFVLRFGHERSSREPANDAHHEFDDDDESSANDDDGSLEETLDVFDDTIEESGENNDDDENDDDDSREDDDHDDDNDGNDITIHPDPNTSAGDFADELSDVDALINAHGSDDHPGLSSNAHILDENIDNMDVPPIDEDEDDEDMDDEDIDEEEAENDMMEFSDALGQYLENVGEGLSDIRSISNEINRLNVHTQQLQSQFHNIRNNVAALRHNLFISSGNHPHNIGFPRLIGPHQLSELMRSDNNFHPERLFTRNGGVLGHLLIDNIAPGFAMQPDRADMDRRRIEGEIPFFLDRLQEQARSLDSSSLHYLGILISSYLLTKLEQIEPTEQKDEVKKAMTELTPDLLPTNGQQDTGASAADSQTSSEMPISNTSTAETINNAPQTGQPQAELPQGNLTEASEPQNQPAIANESDQQQPPDESNQQPSNISDQPSTSSAGAEGAQSSVTDEYRAILGDIEIPEGIDPAFLAALPDDMRQEVINDHNRQRQTRTQQNPELANLPEGIDQAFLAELPEEMVSEVIRDFRRQQQAREQQNRQPNINDLVGERGHPLSAIRHHIIHPIRHSHRPIQPYRMRIYHPHADVIAASAQTPNITGTEKGVQLLDRDSIVTILLLYFLDHEKSNIVRLQQKFLKLLCLHSATCDFIIWCLLSMLNLILETEGSENFTATNTHFKGFLNGFQFNLTLNQSEKTFNLLEDKVKLHPSMKVSVCQTILDNVAFLAKNFPHHFMPDKMRLPDRTRFDSVPNISHFWDTARRIDNMSVDRNEPRSNASIRNIIAQQLEQAPIAFLLKFCTASIAKDNLPLLDKNIRILQTLAQIIPSNSEPKLNERSMNWLNANLREFINVILALPLEQGLKDGRSFLVEILRAIPSQRTSIIKTLCHVTELQGKGLNDKISALLKTIRDRQANQQPNINESLNELTGKDNQQRKLLKSLETLSYVQTELKKSSTQKKFPAASTIAVDPEVYDREAGKVTTSLLTQLKPLWSALSECLTEMGGVEIGSQHTVLSLQSAAEAFFLAHSLSFPALGKEGDTKDAAPTTIATPSSSHSPPKSTELNKAELTQAEQDVLVFAEKHRAILNQILRQTSNNLENGAFSILTHFPKLLDFDVKRKYFLKEIRKFDDRHLHRHDDIAIHVRRTHIFSDSFRELFRLKTSDWRSRFYVVFEGEEGQDAGGLLREWYSIITREIFNPMYALFITAPGDRVTYMINKSSYINQEHLQYFKFVGRLIAKAIYDNKQLDCYFTRAFYKHILGKKVTYRDIESEDPSFFKSMEFLLENPVECLGSELTFSLEVEEFGVRSIRPLKEDGIRIVVTDQNKEEYVREVCQMKMTGSIRKQLDSFLEGFYEIIPKRLISIFNEQELELLVSGMPEIDIDDLFANTEYKGGYNRSSTQVQWFWRALRTFEKEDLAKFLQFVTGTSKVPLQGFSQLEGMNGTQRFTIYMDSRSTNRLPSAHTCFNQLDLPCYDSYDRLHQSLLTACRECSEGFAFA